MTGFLETLVRYIDVFDSDPFADAAARARAEGATGQREDAEAADRDMERGSRVLFGERGER